MVYRHTTRAEGYVLSATITPFFGIASCAKPKGERGFGPGLSVPGLVDNSGD